MCGSDEIYIESWKATLSLCEQRLEPTDYERATEVSNIEECKKELDQLQNVYSEDTPLYVIGLLYSTLDHYEQLTRSFIKMMAYAVDLSMIWGLLYLVVKASCSDPKISRLLLTCARSYLSNRKALLIG